MAERTESARKCRREGGFALLEVLVAFAIFAGAFVVLLQSAGIAARRIEESRRLDRSTALGRSVLARIGHEIPATAIGSTGRAGDLVWNLTITPLSGPAGALPVLEARVRVTQDGRAAGITLVTLRRAEGG